MEFTNRFAGTGIVEASSRNISIGAHLPGIVARVHVKVGERVKAGSPLFSIDDRARLADLAVREARVREAEANLQDLRAQLQIAEKVKDPRAISTDDVNKRRFAAQAAVADRGEVTISAERIAVKGPDNGSGAMAGSGHHVINRR